MTHPARAIARDLAGQAERLCRTYLANGRREGNYWLVGDVHNTPGRSLYVRLRDSPGGTGRAGKWSDAQSGEHGDLLDIVRAATPGGSLADAIAEARRFLSLPDEESVGRRRGQGRVRPGSPDAARRLIAISRPVCGSLAEHYLHARGLGGIDGLEALHFHPRCWYKRSPDDRRCVPRAMPAMIASVTDLAGRITGAHRTWLRPDGAAKAAVACPRRAMGHLLGHGVRFGRAAAVMAAGEGIETTLSIRATVPNLSVIAALSATHLAALIFPPGLVRLYVAREPDRAGRRAFARLCARGSRQGIAVLPLDAEGSDLNADLRSLGVARLRERIALQMHAEDRP